MLKSICLIYKLMLISSLVSFCQALFTEILRKLLQESFETNFNNKRLNWYFIQITTIDKAQGKTFQSMIFTIWSTAFPRSIFAFISHETSLESQSFPYYLSKSLPPTIIFQFVFHVFTHFLNKLLKKLKIQDEKEAKIRNRMKTNLNLIDIYLKFPIYSLKHVLLCENS